MNEYFINESNQRLVSWLEGTPSVRWHRKISLWSSLFLDSRKVQYSDSSKRPKLPQRENSPPSPPPTSKGVVSGPCTWKTAPRALGNAMMAQDAFLSLVRDFPKKLCQSYGTKIDVQNSNGIKSARGFTEFLNILMHCLVGKWSENFCLFVFL